MRRRRRWGAWGGPSCTCISVLPSWFAFGLSVLVRLLVLQLPIFSEYKSLGERDPVKALPASRVKPERWNCGTLEQVKGRAARDSARLLGQAQAQAVSMCAAAYPGWCVCTRQEQGVELAPCAAWRPGWATRRRGGRRSSSATAGVRLAPGGEEGGSGLTRAVARLAVAAYSSAPLPPLPPLAALRNPGTHTSTTSTNVPDAPTTRTTTTANHGICSKNKKIHSGGLSESVALVTVKRAF